MLWLKKQCDTPLSHCSQEAENTNPLFLKYLIIAAEKALTPSAYLPLCAPSTVRNTVLLASCEVSTIMNELFLSEHVV